MDRICEKQLTISNENVDEPVFGDGKELLVDRQMKAIENEKINQQQMILELLEILFEQGDIQADELQHAKHILYSENIR